MYTQTIRNVSHWSLLVVALFATATTSAGAFDGPATSPEKEKELLALLQSNALPAEKALACKKLAIHGSAGAVPELAKLLPNPQLSSWARIALEAIPGEASSEALRVAAGSLDAEFNYTFSYKMKPTNVVVKMLRNSDNTNWVFVAKNAA